MRAVLNTINPKVLMWARETAHFAVEDIPKTIIPNEKLRQIEAGEAYPTLRQLERLANKYDRSLHILISKEIPKDNFLRVPLFRKNNKLSYSAPLALFIRDIQKKQSWVRNFLISEGASKLNFIGSIQTLKNVHQTAESIRTSLKLPTHKDFHKNTSYFTELKNQIEQNNIFVSITGNNNSSMPISLEDAHGFAIVDDFAPFVFLNTNNTTNAKIFTLIHEIVHLFIGKTGITENALSFRNAKCYEDEIENFCNSVASEILLPKKIFLEEFVKCNLKEIPIRESVSLLAKKFLVSELAICVKLWKLNKINFKEYIDLYTRVDSEIKEFLKRKRIKQKEKKGGNYYPTLLAKNSRLLSTIAFYAYKENKILGNDLYNILKVNLDKLSTYFSAI